MGIKIDIKHSVKDEEYFVTTLQKSKVYINDFVLQKSTGRYITKQLNLWALMKLILTGTIVKCRINFTQ